jgi:type II secretory pathway pseudopilin PulG
MRTHLRSDARGFTLVDIVATIAVLGVLLAVAVPSLIAGMEGLRLGQATREVEREIHMAKSRAVSKGRAIRIRFNCPGAREYRITEIIGTVSLPAAADSAPNRCDPMAYPFPPADYEPLTLPNLDGPVRRLPDEISFTAPQTIEFWPNGTAHYEAGAAVPWPLIPVAGIPIAITREDKTATIRVNGLGKINIEQ